MSGWPWHRYSVVYTSVVQITNFDKTVPIRRRISLRIITLQGSTVNAIVATSYTSYQS